MITTCSHRLLLDLRFLPLWGRLLVISTSLPRISTGPIRPAAAVLRPTAVRPTGGYQGTRMPGITISGGGHEFKSAHRLQWGRRFAIPEGSSAHTFTPVGLSCRHGWLGARSCDGLPGPGLRSSKAERHSRRPTAAFINERWQSAKKRSAWSGAVLAGRAEGVGFEPAMRLGPHSGFTHRSRARSRRTGNGPPPPRP